MLHQTLAFLQEDSTFPRIHQHQCHFLCSALVAAHSGVILNKLNCGYVVGKGGQYVVGTWLVYGRYVVQFNLFTITMDRSEIN